MSNYRRTAHTLRPGLVAAAILWQPRASAAEPAAHGASHPPRDTGADAADRQQRSGEDAAALEARAELGVLSRDFEYHQDVNDNLRDQQVSLAPTIGARLGWYPGAHFAAGGLANLGIVGEYERSLFASSSTELAEDFDTVMQGYAIGARWRFPFERHQIGLSFVYGRHQLSVDSGREPSAVSATGQSVARDYVPDVAYVYARPGLDGRFAFGRIHAGLGLGYRAIQDVGDVGAAEWFPQATARAIDGWLTVGFAIQPQLIVFGTAAFTRYALAMNSTVQDLDLARDVAGGAIDQTIAGRVGVEWRLAGAEPTTTVAAGSRR
jgi:hypothetical protein